jgi:hypothetical protein
MRSPRVRMIGLRSGIAARAKIWRRSEKRD